MLKNLTSNQLLLIALAAVLFLMAAFSFYLLQDPSAPLPFAPAAASSTPTPPIPSQTLTQPPSSTPIPTRQTSYTPFATLLTPVLSGPATLIPPTKNSEGVGTTTSNPSTTVLPGGATPSKSPTRSVTSATLSVTTSPTITETLTLGEHGVTGRVLQNGTPVANVVVGFEDDVAPRQSTTNPTGHYWFTTLAPGTTFSLTFHQRDNTQLNPASGITSLARIRGTLPIQANIIDLPDFEISINLNGMIFELQTPMDGAAYSASVISSSNPIQFIWTLYSLGGSYHIEIGSQGSDQPLWTSSQIASTNYMWDGTLSDGTHITQGTYWWRVAVTKSLGNYVVVIFTQPWDLVFNP